MLELLISILLTLGIKAEPVNGKIAISKEVISQIQTQVTNNPGSNVTFDDIIIIDNVDPNH